MAAVHTIGTRSLANVRHDMEQKKGGKVSRAEVFKVAYTRKDGRPQPARQETLAKIDEKLTEEAEFVDKPIQEGDFLSELIGKENRGRVIGVGMGPTPASLGLPGTKSTARINLQLEREARQRAEDEARALRDEMQQLEQRMEERMEQRLVEKLAEFKAMISDSAEQRHNLHIPNEEHSCTSASNIVQVQPRTAGALQHNKNKLLEKDSLRRVGGRYYAQGLEEHVGNHNSTKPPRIANNRSQARTCNKATSKCSNVPATTTTVIVEGVQKQVANYYSGRPARTGGANKGKGEHSRVKKAATTTIQVGNDVFLKRIVRPYNRVAKATVESQDPLEMVGGTVLGNECYKVVVDSPIFGDAELFRPFKNLNYIKDAIGHSIAWPIHLFEEVPPPRQNGEVTKTGGRVSLAPPGTTMQNWRQLL